MFYSIEFKKMKNDMKQLINLEKEINSAYKIFCLLYNMKKPIFI